MIFYVDNKKGVNEMETIKYIEYDKIYLEEINDFVNESMHKFINRPYKVRQDVANIEESYIKDGGNFWVAIDTNLNKIVGTIGLKKMKDIGIVRRFYIQEEYQNRKIGTNLYQTLEKYCRENNIKILYLTCVNVLEKAHRFYLNNGYKQIDKMEIDIHVGENEDSFKKVL